jgi:hypothetical protein
LGGEILIADVLRDGVPVERQAWNRLESGVEIDLTREQFQREKTRSAIPRSASRSLALARAVATGIPS